MDIWASLRGYVEVELTSADPEGAIYAVNRGGIVVNHAVRTGDLTWTFQIPRSDLKPLKILIQRRGDRLQVRGRQGVYWIGKELLKRPVLVAGICILVLLTVLLPKRILFVEVEGNVTIPTNLILERAADCGIEFGAVRRTVRSEQMKNKLLQAVPELQWAGINTYGCRAVISVRERPAEEISRETVQVSNIVASRDGVIKEVTVLSGTRICKTGQAVKAGQILISGYTDCGICIRATQARGEVFAETKRDLVAVTPMEQAEKGAMIRQEKKYRLVVGKKQINFSKDSGISGTSCDKMYTVNYITLPGGLKLPVAVITETITYYECAPLSLDASEVQGQLSRFAESYLSGDMIAGQILEKHETENISNDLFILRGEYSCLEMIGKTRLEENLIDDG